MVSVINYDNRAQHKLSLDAMFRDRKRIFIDLLKWDIPADGPHERDQFDDEEAEYLVVMDRGTGEHLGSVRLLRTDRPHILGDLFPDLCDRPVPTGASIREITRLCLSPRLRARQRREVRDRLATALIEYGLLTGITSYTGVAELGWLTQILALGWRCDPLGMPKPVGTSLLGALQIHVDANSIQLLRAAGTYAATSLQLANPARVAA